MPAYIRISAALKKIFRRGHAKKSIPQLRASSASPQQPCMALAHIVQCRDPRRRLTGIESHQLHLQLDTNLLHYSFGLNINSMINCFIKYTLQFILFEFSKAIKSLEVGRM